MPELLLDNFSRERMLELSNNMRSPVVIRGAIKQSKAVKTWNDKVLQKFYGNERVLISDVVNDVGKRKEIEATLKEFFDMKKTKYGHSATIAPSSSIEDQSLVCEFLSPIEDQLVGPHGEKNVTHHLFSTSSEDYNFRSEIGNNIFRQVVGKKVYTLIDPQYNFYLCPAKGLHTSTEVQSCINNLPFEKRDAWIKKIPRYAVILQPGDILVNGGYWWYDISSVERQGKAKRNGNGDMMIGVTSHIKNIKGSLSNAPLHTIAASVLRFY